MAQLDESSVFIAKTSRFLAGIMLIIAVANLPYDYYQVLRIVVFGAGLYSFWFFQATEKINWAIFFLASAILFNPILPLHLNKGVWVVFDIIFGITYLYSLTVKDEGLE